MTSGKPAEIDAYRVGQSVADLTNVLDALEIETRARRRPRLGRRRRVGVRADGAASALDKLAVLSVGHPACTPRGLEQREKSWYMLLFQFPEAEEILRTNDWALLREWMREPPGPRRGSSG